jgi:hypothetical protein
MSTAVGLNLQPFILRLEWHVSIEGSTLCPCGLRVRPSRAKFRQKAISTDLSAERILGKQAKVQVPWKHLKVKSLLQVSVPLLPNYSTRLSTKIVSCLEQLGKDNDLDSAECAADMPKQPNCPNADCPAALTQLQVFDCERLFQCCRSLDNYYRHPKSSSRGLLVCGSSGLIKSRIATIQEADNICQFRQNLSDQTCSCRQPAFQAANPILPDGQLRIPSLAK